NPCETPSGLMSNPSQRLHRANLTPDRRTCVGMILCARCRRRMIYTGRRLSRRRRLTTGRRPEEEDPSC
ncbi:MAG TPA: hypothetical protein VFO63_00095, partial [Blastocatellia bacterium]|nr:hypothetical protein [Blastocatellia bacterium]